MLEYTRQLWKDENPKYNIFISELVIAEIRGIEEDKRRTELLELVKDFSEIKLTSEIESISQGYVSQGIIPQSHFPDALHIAITSLNKIDFLIT